MSKDKAGFSSNIWKLNGIRMLFWMHFFGPFLVHFLTQWGGLNLSQFFYLNAWFFFCNFLFDVPTGAVADFLGKRPRWPWALYWGGSPPFFIPAGLF